MTIQEDMAQIPRKQKNGVGRNKSVTSIYVDPIILDAMRAIAKANNVSISGVIELALTRLFADMDTESELNK